MCQLQGLNLWVLQGILSPGGEKCPGLFLYVRVEDYSDWITAKTRTDSLLPLSVFHHYHHHQEPPAPRQGPLAPTPGPQPRGPARVTVFMARSRRPDNSSLEAAASWGKGVRASGVSPGEEALAVGEEEGVPPAYYDYYSEPEAGPGGFVSGQDRRPGPHETLLLCPALVFLWSRREAGS